MLLLIGEVANQRVGTVLHTTFLLRGVPLASANHADHEQLVLGQVDQGGAGVGALELCGCVC